MQKMQQRAGMIAEGTFLNYNVHGNEFMDTANLSFNAKQPGEKFNCSKQKNRKYF
jgi:hypothetical protein